MTSIALGNPLLINGCIRAKVSGGSPFSVQSLLSGQRWRRMISPSKEVWGGWHVLQWRCSREMLPSISGKFGLDFETRTSRSHLCVHRLEISCGRQRCDYVFRFHDSLWATALFYPSHVQMWHQGNVVEVYGTWSGARVVPSAPCKLPALGLDYRLFIGFVVWLVWSQVTQHVYAW
jgi:hypothetical protein